MRMAKEQSKSVNDSALVVLKMSWESVGRKQTQSDSSASQLTGLISCLWIRLDVCLGMTETRNQVHLYL